MQCSAEAVEWTGVQCSVVCSTYPKHNTTAAASETTTAACRQGHGREPLRAGPLRAGLLHAGLLCVAVAAVEASTV